MARAEILAAEEAHNTKKRAEAEQDIAARVAQMLRAGQTSEQIAVTLGVSVEFVLARKKTWCFGIPIMTEFGKLDYRDLANLHRPKDKHTFRVAANERSRTYRP